MSYSKKSNKFKGRQSTCYKIHLICKQCLCEVNKIWIYNCVYNEVEEIVKLNKFCHIFLRNKIYSLTSLLKNTYNSLLGSHKHIFEC
jgi:hypothetical protein